MVFDFILLFFGSAFLSFLIAFLIEHIKSPDFLKLFTKSARIQDIHKGDIYRIGGIIIFFSISLLLFFYPDFPIKKEWLALFISALILVIGGVLDDIFDLKPIWQFLFQGVATSTFIVFGNIKISFINAPFLGQIVFNDFWGILIPFILIIFFVNVFNFLDGIDGVASGVGFLAFLSIFIISLSLPIKQIPPAIFALIMAGVLFGFLFFNQPPAKIFLGTAGSNLIGFLLGALSIIAGSKILTLLIVSILPAVDALMVIVRRFKRKKSIFKADTSHLHHILFKKGFTPRNIFNFYIFSTAFFTIGALFLQNYLKFIFFVFCAGVIFLVINKMEKGIKN